MKQSTLKLGVIALFFVLFSNVQDSFAQRLSLTANVNLFANGEGTEDLDDIDLSLDEQRAYSLNLRLYDKNLWALRLGVGTDKLTYNIEDQSSNIDEVVRENLTAFIGLEKHFNVLFLSPYAGVYVPVTFNTKDVLGSTEESFKNGDVTAGFSVLAGANIKLLKFLRVGAEFNVGFSRFKSGVFDPLISGDASDISLNRLDYNTEITVGVAF